MQLTAIGDDHRQFAVNCKWEGGHVAERDGGGRRSALSPRTSAGDVGRCLETRLETKARLEPDGVRNIKNYRRTGASEIDRVKVAPTFRDTFGRSQWG